MLDVERFVGKQWTGLVEDLLPQLRESTYTTNGL